MNIQAVLQERLVAALSGLVDDPTPFAAYARPGQPGRGDYQIEAKCFFELGKALGRKAPDLASEVVSRMQLSDLFDAPKITPPAFVNLNLRDDVVADLARKVAGDERLGVVAAAKPRTYVVDYSSPNVAKPLHVGHLRSTIIGDALARILRFLGHKVITDNHLGDWGTQFGILLYGYKNLLDCGAYAADPIQELARIYKEVRSLFKDDDEDAAGDDPVQQACRTETAKLQAGDAENVALWKQFMPHCLAEIQAIYDRLGILPFDHMHGESFYNEFLSGVVADMLEKKIAVESQGAVIIPNAKGVIPTTEEELKSEEPPGLIRKKDGAFTYTTSDLATIHYRMEHFQPDAMLYVVDFRQALHFKTFFAQARRWGYPDAELQHIQFGSVMGSDGKPFSTSKGTGALLEVLLSQAIAAAKEVHDQLIVERREAGQEVPDFTEQEKQAIHEAVGIGAVKYADLSQNRTSDYVFDPKKMTSTKGNTATYMQYAYVRNRGIFRKGDVDPDALRQELPLVLLAKPQERALAMQLLRFSEALSYAAADYRPNLITAYLWDLCNTFSSFFENCPVLKAETPELRASRLLLCDLTARIIQKALDLLGIRTIERM